MEKLKPFLDDDRKPIEVLYEEYEKLISLGFEKKLIYVQKTPNSLGEVMEFPIYAFVKGEEGKDNLWIFSGVHGEEPPGPEAIAAEIEYLGELGQIPMIIIPLCNPVGRYIGWRYQDAFRDHHIGTSVSDSEHLLLKEGEDLPRVEKATNATAEAITAFVVENSLKYPPLLSIDFHEDEALPQSYIYSQGSRGVTDPVAREIVQIMQDSGMEIQMQGDTRFGEPVVDGVVLATVDGSIDELMATAKIFFKGEIISKPFAKTVIVVETPTIGALLPKRVQAHRNIIRAIRKLWEMTGKKVDTKNHPVKSGWV